MFLIFSHKTQAVPTPFRCPFRSSCFPFNFPRPLASYFRSFLVPTSFFLSKIIANFLPPTHYNLTEFPNLYLLFPHLRPLLPSICSLLRIAAIAKPASIDSHDSPSSYSAAQSTPYPTAVYFCRGSFWTFSQPPLHQNPLVTAEQNIFEAIPERLRAYDISKSATQRNRRPRKSSSPTLASFFVLFGFSDALSVHLINSFGSFVLLQLKFDSHPPLGIFEIQTTSRRTPRPSALSRLKRNGFCKSSRLKRSQTATLCELTSTPDWPTATITNITEAAATVAPAHRVETNAPESSGAGAHS